MPPASSPFGRGCQYVVPPSTVAIANRGTPAATAAARNRSMPSSSIQLRCVPPRPWRATSTGSRSGTRAGIDHRPPGLGAEPVRGDERARYHPARGSRRGCARSARSARAPAAAACARAASPPRRRPPRRTGPRHAGDARRHRATARRRGTCAEGRGLWKASAGSAPVRTQWWDAISGSCGGPLRSWRRSPPPGGRERAGGVAGAEPGLTARRPPRRRPPRPASARPRCAPRWDRRRAAPGPPATRGCSPGCSSRGRAPVAAT